MDPEKILAIEQAEFDREHEKQGTIPSQASFDEFLRYENWKPSDLLDMPHSYIYRKWKSYGLRCEFGMFAS